MDLPLKRPQKPLMHDSPVPDGLERLVLELKSLPRDRDLYHRALCRARVTEDEARRHFHFRTSFYTRNLICRTDDLELLALCWEPGQITPIHDHAGSEGWIYGLMGELEEVRFCCEVSGESAHVEPLSDLRAGVGDVAHINDDIAWHTVGNPTGRRSVSLHLYSPPIDACQWFDLATSTIRKRIMKYDAIDGVLQNPGQ